MGGHRDHGPAPAQEVDAPMQQASSQDRKLVKTSTPGVYKRGGRYVVVVRDADGKQRKKSCRTLAEARTRRAELIGKANRGEEIRESRATVAAYFETWIASYGG